MADLNIILTNECSLCVVLWNNDILLTWIGNTVLQCRMSKPMIYLQSEDEKPRSYSPPPNADYYKATFEDY